MRSKQKRGNEENALAFLDIISCSFGAVVLLLLIVKTTAPEDEEAQQVVMASQSEEVALKEEVGRKKEQLAALSRQVEKSGVGKMAQDKLKGKLQAALQTLDREMRQLKLNPQENKVGGIPADSRYIIFIIDTSGSMKSYAWHKVLEQIEAIMDVYPKVEGMQVLSDMGAYLYPGYKGRWLKDTPARRRRILHDIRSWGTYSNSNPVEGIYTAVRQYAKKTKQMSLYVLGDDFSGSVQQVLSDVERLNSGASGHKVRIHAIGFYTPGVGVASVSFLDFARLSELTRRNGGTFIGINTR